MSRLQRDQAAVTAYENAKLTYIRSVTSRSANMLRGAFFRQRESITGDLVQLRELTRAKQVTADATAVRYAFQLPHRVRKSVIHPPSIWERLRTWNRIDRVYREAAHAAKELQSIKELARQRRERLDVIERETHRSITSREETVRKKLKTREGLATLHDDPMVRRAFVTLQGTIDDRAKYDERDRDMSERGQTFASVPLLGATIDRVARYGALEYYVLRDMSGHEHLLSCDPVLEPLRDSVFDLTQSASGYEAALRHASDGTPLRASRAGPKPNADRPSKTTPPRDANEAEAIAMLGLLARAVAGRAT